MAIEDYDPPRITLTHLKTGDTVSAQFNPTEVEEQLETAWNRLRVLGHTFRPMQYQNTENIKIKFELGFDSHSFRAVNASGGSNIQAALQTYALPNFIQTQGQGRPSLARAWLMACMYPVETAQDVPSGAPSRMLLCWPNMYSLVVRFTKLKFGHRRFDRFMKPTEFSASCEFEFDGIGGRQTYENMLELALIRHDNTVEG